MKGHGSAHAVRIATAGMIAALLAGCSVGVSDEPSAPAATSAPGSSAPTQSTQASAGGDRCYLGRHAVRSITGREALDTPAGPAKAVGNGGSLVLDLAADNTWTLSSNGSKPVSFRVGAYSASARVNGTLRGSYRNLGSAFAFDTSGGNGSTVLSSSVGSARFSMSEVGAALAPDGTARITCEQDAVRLVSDSVEMVLAPAAGGGSAGGAPAAGNTPVAPSPINQSNLNTTFDCGGKPVIVNGSSNRLQLVGRCASVTVNGSDCVIRVSTLGAAAVNGDRSTVLWKAGLDGREPTVAVNGAGSTVKQSP
jgi:Protein of unknown function (DUF3060)